MPTGRWTTWSTGRSGSSSASRSCWRWSQPVRGGTRPTASSSVMPGPPGPSVVPSVPCSRPTARCRSRLRSSTRPLLWADCSAMWTASPRRCEGCETVEVVSLRRWSSFFGVPTVVGTDRNGGGHIELPQVLSGKVRELYDAGDDRLLMVASDRVSAFDVIMAEPIRHKGRVLTAMTCFWSDEMSDVVPGTLLAVDPGDIAAALPGVEVPAEWAGRAVLVRRAEMLQLECIVRGYL